MGKLRSFCSTLLCLVVLVASQQMAVARGASGPAGEMIICTGAGAITILVDADGNPTGQVHHCPDCALSLFVDVPPLAIAALPVLTFVSASVSGRAMPPGQGPLGHAFARGPPEGAVFQI